MSSSKNLDLSSLIPGFDAIKQMAGQIPGVGKGLGAAGKNPFMPNPGSWIAPMLSVEELEKRITELQTVKLWLENNARLIEATTQALQVQKMTLSTLQDMKINLGKAWPGMATASKAPSAATKSSRSRSKTHFDLGQTEEPAPSAKRSSGGHKEAAAQATDAAADTSATMQMASQQAMQMWQGLTQQFGQITSQVMQDSQAAAEKLARSSASVSAPATTAAKKRSAAAKAPRAAAKKTSTRSSSASSASRSRSKK